MYGIVKFMFEAFVVIGLTGVLLSTLISIGAALWGKDIYNPFKLLKFYLKKAHKYQVIETKYTSHMIIDDGGSKLYVSLPSDQQTIIKNLIILNPESTVSIKAVIDPVDFTVKRIKGYSVE